MQVCSHGAGGSIVRVATAAAALLASSAWIGQQPGDDGLPEPNPWPAEPTPADDTCAPPEPGFLTLDTAPWTVVYVDGVYAGSTPLFRQKLQPGPHTLTLVNEGRELKASEDVVIEEGRYRKLKLVLAIDEAAHNALDASNDAGINPEDCFIPPEEAANLSVDTSPWSKVYVDGKLIGSTPLFKHPIVAGDHVVRLVRGDGKASFARFSATTGETVKLSLSL